MRVYAGIDLDAVCHNVSLIQEKIGSNVRMMAVIKANGYGHGAVQLARALNRRNGVYAFAVATVQEAAELRKNGIENPVLVLGYSFPETYDDIVRYDISQTVFDLESAAALSHAAARTGKNVKVHVKIDTGMGRIGAAPDRDGLRLIQDIQRLPNITVEGIFTHFACADEADKTSANHQKEKFFHFLNIIKEEGIQIPIRHDCNSASIMEFDDRYLDMVRAGIIIYGLYPSHEVDRNTMRLRPAMSLHSHISFVKTLPPGCGISYGSTYITPTEKTIATVPVGYGDGYPRQLGNRARVLVRGAYAPIVGRVCMDQFMIDVTDIPGVTQGDEVVLVGTMDGKRITVEELADSVGSFNYEFVCGINRRVPRVFLEDGKISEIIDYLE